MTEPRTLLDEAMSPEEQASLSPLLRYLAEEGAEWREAVDQWLEEDLPPMEEDDQVLIPVSVAAADERPARLTYQGEDWRVAFFQREGRWFVQRLAGPANAFLSMGPGDQRLPLLRSAVPYPEAQPPEVLMLWDAKGTLHALHRRD